MYLKALEIQGFKSFPDRTVLPFTEAVTAVVGPNGSGKSNILDAIRWVFGEQSAKNLRGGKMEDVIFVGTEKRNQTSYAQVSLVMDNSQGIFDMEETEVMVTRKYFRSGDSIYYINKHQVRLRDVNELFMGTGMGKEGYAIIGQGKIDEILSVKSGQRREVFEEAAGIAKYRHQKEESEKKLNRAEENLQRAQDKITEMELQLEPLRKQSETASQYLLFRDELRDLEISVWLEQLEDVRLSKVKLNADYTKSVEEKDKTSQAVDDLYQKVEELGEEMRKKTMEAEEVRKSLTVEEGEVSACEADVTVLKNKITNNNENAQRLVESLEQKEAREQEYRKQIEEIETKLEELLEKRESLSHNTEEKTKASEALEAEVINIGRELEQLRQSSQSESNSVGEAKAKLSALTSSTQEIYDQDQQMRQDLLMIEEKIATETELLAQQQQELKLAEDGKQEAKNKVDGYGLGLEGNQKKLEGLIENLRKLNQENYAKNEKIKLLENMEQMYDGFNTAVKKVMTAQKQGQLRNIHGPVAGLITVPKDFTVAIETALGGAMQNLVVDQFQDGKAVIEYLKRQNAGRVTILPLATMKPRFLSQGNALQNEVGFVGIASELLNYEPQYVSVIRNLLGNVVVMENLDCANVTAKKFNHQFRIVTLDGQVLNQGGSMTGGSANRSAGILGRKEELNQLKVDVVESRNKVGTLEEEIKDVETLMSGSKYQLNIAQNDLRGFEDGILQWSGSSRETERRLNDLQQQSSQKQNQVNLLNQRAETIEQSTQKAQEDILQQEQKVVELQEKYQDLFEQHASLQLQWNEAKEISVQLQASVQTLEVEENSLIQNKETIQKLFDELEGERGENASLIEKYTGDNEKYDSEILQKEQELQKKRESCSQLLQKIQDLNGAKDQMEATRIQTDKEAKEKNNHLISLERSVAGLEQKKIAAEGEENQILDKFWEVYKLSHQEAVQKKIELESIPKAVRRINELKRDIESLGHINIDAITEFEKINERYTYFTDQRDDITQAKRELEKIITEIVKEMEEIFATEFRRINEAFGEIFVKLFGGGRAEVYLEDSSDVLGTGIEIKAQPPGKALKILSLLSGGEKALIAIALYFAILRIRPSPFVVMDEIEAALDDHNIDRFVKYVRQVSDKTQFILITHRRGSMEAADVLYGITMQEQGVSRMLRLSLNDVERELNIKLR